MKTRKLGNSDVDISAIGLGCMTMTGIYDEADDAESIATIHAALDAGLNFIDTADAYGGGSNEKLVGEALKDRRDEAFLATKFGNVYARDPNRGADGRPEYVKEACDASLQRLGVDVIDLYFQHRVDKEVPIEETVGAMSELVSAGKVRYLGLSEAGSDTIRRAHAVHPISALQSEFSVWCRFAEEDQLKTCNELGITYVAYSPLGRGFLTGSMTSQSDMPEKDRRRDHPRFQGDNFDHNLGALHAVQAIADSKGVKPAQIAIAYCLAKNDALMPIPGTKRRTYLAENIAAADIGLTADDIAELEAAVPADFTAGARYPDAQMWTVGL